MPEQDMQTAIGRLEGMVSAIQTDIGRILDALKEVSTLKQDVASLQEWRDLVDQHLNSQRDIRQHSRSKLAEIITVALVSGVVGYLARKVGA